MADDAPAWFKRIGIDRTCRLVAMCRGMVTLTRTDDGTHTLWLYDAPIASGPAALIRPLYAQYLPDDWLRHLYA